MPNEKFIKNFSEFTKISEGRLENYLKNNDTKTLLEHFETIEPTENQLKNFKDLKRLSNVYAQLLKYKEYKFDKSTDAVNYLRNEYENLFDKERVISIFLDKENKLLGKDEISVGTINSSIVHPRDVFKKAIQYNADKIILSHNHPSGYAKKSDEDLIITEKLEKAGNLFNIQILDHIIITKNDYYSFAEDGYLSNNDSIEKTNNKIHEKIYREDIDKTINLLNKFIKTPKKELKDIFKNVSINAFNKNPQNYLKNKEQLNRLNMLKEIKTVYLSEINSLKPVTINSTDTAKNYIERLTYNYNEDINVVLYLDTQYKMINHQLLPLNMRNESEHILKNAILYDSNSIMLATKNNNVDYDNLNTSIERVWKIKDNAEIVGINLLDNIEKVNGKTRSFAEEHLLEANNSKKTNLFEGKNDYKKTSKQVNKQINNMENEKLSKPRFSINQLSKKSKEMNKNKRNEQIITKKSKKLL